MSQISIIKKPDVQEAQTILLLFLRSEGKRMG